MKLTFSSDEITKLLQPTAQLGATNETISSIAALKDAQPGDLSFLAHTKYKNDLAHTRASLVLIPADYDTPPPPPAANQLYLKVQNPSAALATLCAVIESRFWPRPHPGIHPSAVIADGVQIAPTATIGPQCVVSEGAVIGEHTHLQAQIFVGRDARIGDQCWISPHVSIGDYCELRDRVRIHSGAVIGSDGFGYESSTGRHLKIPQIGNVVLENDVEIGANTTIDRARFSRTVIGEGTKIDNLVQIGHNVVTGKHCILCAQVGISGSTTLGDYVVLGGQTGTIGHIHIATGTRAGGQTGINFNTEPGSNISGSPALPHMLEFRLFALHKRLPDLFKKVDGLLADVAALKTQTPPEKTSARQP
ncbi:UDP-3-O-(3-hydroxymyristoyl)glucosamine N-acyltransferase [Opitutaceae bacterium TAV4]|uniref:UDP-3-O-(3-hydroxymyristoyl)glucosamine N-acyltransferase n=1 Tax=Geminisphaera colitermitum TaxID=1148786 RepID=UPI000158CF42|nr:UDP-3-O-(3-hydroxymyristoyl)glucosamine N-acyltransferase [Geminisphaera colitermitum]RRJ97925.1 UDP-3-O-(3-hydroxymyristoyl)glucosamine N-acyltransferase [Opitutaceae bacterium TAV4]